MELPSKVTTLIFTSGLAALKASVAAIRVLSAQTVISAVDCWTSGKPKVPSELGVDPPEHATSARAIEAAHAATASWRTARC